MSTVARDYLLALFARVPRFGDVAPNNNPDRVRFDMCPQGDWVQVSDVEALIDHLDDLEADEAWRPIDTYPNDGSAVLGYGPELTGLGIAGGCGQMVITRAHAQPPGTKRWFTHWMPLPEAPK